MYIVLQFLRPRITGNFDLRDPIGYSQPITARHIQNYYYVGLETQARHSGETGDYKKTKDTLYYKLDTGT